MPKKSSHFPLYNSLYKDTVSKDLKKDELEDFIAKFPKLNDYAHELIYVLIFIYNDENTLTPYEGSFKENDVIFDLNKFPNKLKQIIYKFTCTHVQKMEEEVNREF